MAEMGLPSRGPCETPRLASRHRLSSVTEAGRPLVFGTQRRRPSRGNPPITRTSGFETPAGSGFAWAVPGLVLSLPGLLIVLVVIGVQFVGAAAWLPIVRRRIGAFGVGRQRRGSTTRAAPD
jgi:hypothetical protein